MGYWDCPSCNAKKNLGPNATCAACGRPRGANVAFYTDDSAPTIDDPELVARARAGADWKCKYCNADNRAGVMDCAQCGAGPDGTVRREQRLMLDAVPKKASKVLLLAIIGGVLAVLGVSIWFFFVRTTELQVTVDSVAWVKSAVVESLESSREQGWSDQVPSGARRVRSETKSRSKQVQDGTTKVKVGKKDLGNGMFEDIYQEKPKLVDKQLDDEWVTYDVDKWVEREKLKKETTDGTEPDDPAAGRASTDKLRIADRKNQVVLALRGTNGKNYSFEVDVDKDASAKRYKKGQKWKARVTGAGAVTSIGP